MKLIPLFILLFSLNLLADDGYLGTWASNISPLKKLSKDIQMVKEVVYIKMHQLKSEVFCKFWFYNSGKNQTVLVGFPDAKSDYDEKTNQIENFKSIVNNIPLDIKQKLYLDRIDTNSDFNVKKNKTEFYYDSTYTKWFVKDVEFKSNDTTIIEDYYTGNNSGWNEGFSAFYYFLGSGKTWKGSIGEGTIIFDHSDLLSNYFYGRYDKDEKYNNTKMNLLDDFTIYTFTNLKPKESSIVDIGLLDSYSNDKDYIRYPSEFSNKMINFLRSKKYSKVECNIMINEILARLGRPLENKELTEYFSKKSWFEKAMKKELKYTAKLLEKYLKDIKNYTKSLKGKSSKKESIKFRFHPKNENDLLKMIEDAKKEFRIGEIR